MTTEAFEAGGWIALPICIVLALYAGIKAMLDDDMWDTTTVVVGIATAAVVGVSLFIATGAALALFGVGM